MIAALDSLVPVRSGENGHVELDWSNDIQEKIVQFDFQCVRTDANGIETLSTILDSLLSQLYANNDDANKEIRRKELLVVLYKIIGKTRDIEGGKGEYNLSYMMIWRWYKYFPKQATIALSLFVFPPNRLTLLFPLDIIGTDELKEQVPYGSWKDIKYFCDYAKKQGAPSDHPLIQTCVNFINTQLHLDDDAYLGGQPISLAGKWVPRESSERFGWLFDLLAANYFDNFILSAKTDASRAKALKKCKTHYRTLCTKLNRHLDTVQIKQASKQWATIDHSKTTSITIAKQRNAFLNKTKSGMEPRVHDADRVQCAENFRMHFDNLKKEGKEIKGKNVGLETFAAQAIRLVSSHNFLNNRKSPSDVEDAEILNSQWRDNCNKKNANGLGPMVAVVDLSGSMSGDPMNVAVALGCRVAEKSILGRRVMTFSSNPSWINLDGKVTLTEMVQEIASPKNGMGLNTDFYKALDLILDAIEQNRVPPSDVENMIMAVFSDMQIDDNLSATNGTGYNPSEQQKIAARSAWSTMFQNIKNKYAETGMRLYNTPLTPPHILFWNLRQTDGFPTISTEAGCSMMSGYDPAVLNTFCEEGIDALKSMTPYNMLSKQLDNDRYSVMERFVKLVI
jgi:hypothetical protein